MLVPPVDRGVPFDVGWEYIRAILKEEDAVLYPCSGPVAGEVKVLSHLVKVQRYAVHAVGCCVCVRVCACMRACVCACVRVRCVCLYKFYVRTYVW